MIVLGQVCLLIALLTSGYAALAAVRVGDDVGHRGSRAIWASYVSLLALTMVMLVLAVALVTKDFRFNYVVEYSSRQLPWHYSLSALWVGQGGSLLLWCWLLIVLAHAFRWTGQAYDRALVMRVFGVIMCYGFFLVAVMAFAADPVEPSLTKHDIGVGLSPLLQHPAMLVHPPIVFLGYAAWTIPCALFTALLTMRQGRTGWMPLARRWALFAWMVLGVGIVLGGNWAYEELGWGGYWAWDPVENGSLLPWLTGTALIHCLLAWHYRGIMKKSAIAFAMTTFILCNFATFLTRSGIFSSLHAFSQSSIGWMFLALMIVVMAGGAWALWRHRNTYAAERKISSVWSRDAMIFMATAGLALLTGVTLCGTLMVPLSDLLLGHKVVVGVAFFNNALIPVALVLLSASAATPLLRWGREPSRRQRVMLGVSAIAGIVIGISSYMLGTHTLLAVTVFACAGFGVAAFISAVWIDTLQQRLSTGAGHLWTVMLGKRQQYAGYVMHLGFICLAIGIAGSSLGSVRDDFVMQEGETIHWEGYSFQLARMRQASLPDKVIADVELIVTRGGRHVCRLYPAQHLHRHQNEWTTEVAIDANWTRDIYTILHGTAGPQEADLTLVINPLTRWIWVGTWIFAIGTAVQLWPTRTKQPPRSAIAKPKFLERVGSRTTAASRS